MAGKSKKKPSYKKPLQVVVNNEHAVPKNTNNTTPQTTKPVVNENKLNPVENPKPTEPAVKVEEKKEKIIVVEEKQPVVKQSEKTTNFENNKQETKLQNEANNQESSKNNETQLVKTEEKPSPYVIFFESALKSNFSVKHPLKNKWTLWFDKPPPKRNDTNLHQTWGDRLERICTFEYLEDFWGLYHNIPAVSKLAYQSNYHLFKEGIVPKWEDPMNENGGRWMVNVSKSSRQIDDYFMKAMMACIGELITLNEDEVCGVVATIKPSEDRISLWCYSTPDESSITRKCGLKFKELLGIPADTKMYFQSAKEGIGGGRAIPSQLNYI